MDKRINDMKYYKRHYYVLILKYF